MVDLLHVEKGNTNSTLYSALLYDYSFTFASAGILLIIADHSVPQ